LQAAVAKMQNEAMAKIKREAADKMEREVMQKIQQNLVGGELGGAGVPNDLLGGSKEDTELEDPDVPQRRHAERKDGLVQRIKQAAAQVEKADRDENDTVKKKETAEKEPENDTKDKKVTANGPPKEEEEDRPSAGKNKENRPAEKEAKNRAEKKEPGHTTPTEPNNSSSEVEILLSDVDRQKLKRKKTETARQMVDLFRKAEKHLSAFERTQDDGERKQGLLLEQQSLAKRAAVLQLGQELAEDERRRHARTGATPGGVSIEDPRLVDAEDQLHDAQLAALSKQKLKIRKALKNENTEAAERDYEAAKEEEEKSKTALMTLQIEIAEQVKKKMGNKDNGVEKDGRHSDSGTTTTTTAVNPAKSSSVGKDKSEEEDEVEGKSEYEALQERLREADFKAELRRPHPAKDTKGPEEAPKKRADNHTTADDEEDEIREMPKKPTKQSSDKNSSPSPQSPKDSGLTSNKAAESSVEVLKRIGDSSQRTASTTTSSTNTATATPPASPTGGAPWKTTTMAAAAGVSHEVSAPIVGEEKPVAASSGDTGVVASAAAVVGPGPMPDLAGPHVARLENLIRKLPDFIESKIERKTAAAGAKKRGGPKEQSVVSQNTPPGSGNHINIPGVSRINSSEIQKTADTASASSVFASDENGNGGSGLTDSGKKQPLYTGRDTFFGDESFFFQGVSPTKRVGIVDSAISQKVANRQSQAAQSIGGGALFALESSQMDPFPKPLVTYLPASRLQNVHTRDEEPATKESVAPSKSSGKAAATGTMVTSRITLGQVAAKKGAKNDSAARSGSSARTSINNESSDDKNSKLLQRYEQALSSVGCVQKNASASEAGPGQPPPPPVGTTSRFQKKRGPREEDLRWFARTPEHDALQALHGVCRSILERSALPEEHEFCCGSKTCEVSQCQNVLTSADVLMSNGFDSNKLYAKEKLHGGEKLGIAAAGP